MKKGQKYAGNIVRSSADMARWFAQRPAEPVLEPELPIIDAHHHLWDHRKSGSVYLFEQYQQDLQAGHRIVSTVYMEASSMYCKHAQEHLRPVGEITFAAGAAAMAESGLYGETRVAEAIVGYADMRLGAAVREVLEAEMAAAGGRLRGIRHYTAYDAIIAGEYASKVSSPHLLKDATFQAGIAELHKLGLSYDAWVFHTQLDDVYALAQAFPELPIVLDHAGTLTNVDGHARNPDTPALWRSGMERLSRLPNVVVKLGGLGMPICGFDFHLRDLPPTSEELAQAWHPTVETCLELFGADRCMFESNFPVDRQSCGYVELWNAFKRLTQAMSADERRALFSGTAARVYQVQVP